MICGLAKYALADFQKYNYFVFQRVINSNTENNENSENDILHEEAKEIQLYKIVSVEEASSENIVTKTVKVNIYTH